MSVDTHAVAPEQNDASREQADGASVGVAPMEAAGQLVRVIVSEEGRAEAIEALREDTAAARALARTEVHGVGRGPGFVEGGGFEPTKGGNDFLGGARFIGLVMVGACERSGERHGYLRPRGRRPHLRRTAFASRVPRRCGRC